MGKLNVAIADDNQMTLELLGDIVSSDNELQVIGTAKDGEEAYHLIKEKEPDVVLLDIVMPKLDGLGVLEKIRSDGTMKNRPTFLMISAVGNECITEDAFAKGADYYIMKPFDYTQILDRIKSVRNRRNVKDVRNNTSLENHNQQYLRSLCRYIIWICSIRLPKCYIRELPRSTRRHQAVWNEQSVMQSRLRGAEVKWIHWMNCLGIRSAMVRGSRPIPSLLR